MSEVETRLSRRLGCPVSVSAAQDTARLIVCVYPGREECLTLTAEDTQPNYVCDELGETLLVAQLTYICGKALAAHGYPEPQYGP